MRRTAFRRLLFGNLWLHNGTWTIDGATMINAPSVGSDLLVDGGIENWTNSTTPTSWVATIAGASTVTKESSVVHGGSFAAALTSDGSNSVAQIDQNLTTTTDAWYQFSAWARTASGTSSFNMRFGLADTLKSLTTTYAKFFITARSTGSSSLYARLKRQFASTTTYVDDAEVRKLTTNTLFCVRYGIVFPTAVTATGTINIGNWCGVVYGLDSLSSPANAILAIHDGQALLHLIKIVAGAWTVVLSQSVNYVAGQLPGIQRVGADTYAIYYNGTQQGASQTISDAGSGKLHGVFSTSLLNTITLVRIQN